MQTQGMQEGRKTLHHDQNGQCEQSPGTKDEEQTNGAGIALHLQTQGQHHCPQDLRQFCNKYF